MLRSPLNAAAQAVRALASPRPGGAAAGPSANDGPPVQHSLNTSLQTAAEPELGKHQEEITVDQQDQPQLKRAEQPLPAVQLPRATAPQSGAAAITAPEVKQTEGWSPSKLDSLRFFLKSTSAAVPMSVASAQPPPPPSVPAGSMQQHRTEPAGAQQNGSILDPSRPYVGLKYLLLGAGAGGTPLPVTWLSQQQGRQQAAQPRFLLGGVAADAATGAGVSSWGGQGVGRAPRAAPGKVQRYQPYTLAAPTSRARVLDSGSFVLPAAPPAAASAAPPPLTFPSALTPTPAPAQPRPAALPAPTQPQPAAPTPALVLTPPPASLDRGQGRAAEAATPKFLFGTPAATPPPQPLQALPAALPWPRGAAQLPLPGPLAVGQALAASGGGGGLKRRRDDAPVAVTPLVGSGIKSLAEYKRQRQRHSPHPHQATPGRSLLALTGSAARTPRALHTPQGNSGGGSRSSTATPQGDEDGAAAGLLANGSGGKAPTETARRILETLDNMSKAHSQRGPPPPASHAPAPLKGATGAPQGRPAPWAATPPPNTLHHPGATPFLRHPPPLDRVTPPHSLASTPPPPGARSFGLWAFAGGDTTPASQGGASSPDGSQQRPDGPSLPLPTLPAFVPASVVVAPAADALAGLRPVPSSGRTKSADRKSVRFAVPEDTATTGPAPTLPSAKLPAEQQQQPAAPAFSQRPGFGALPLVSPPATATKAATVPSPTAAWGVDGGSPAAAAPTFAFSALAEGGDELAVLRAVAAACAAAPDATPAMGAPMFAFGRPVDLLGQAVAEARKGPAAQQQQAGPTQQQQQAAKVPFAAAPPAAEPAPQVLGSLLTQVQQAASIPLPDEDEHVPGSAGQEQPGATADTMEPAKAPGATAGGWDPDFLKTNVASLNAANTAVAKEIDKAATPAPAAAVGGWDSDFLKTNAASLNAANTAVAKEIDKAATPSASPLFGSQGGALAFAAPSPLPFTFGAPPGATAGPLAQPPASDATAQPTQLSTTAGAAVGGQQTDGRAAAPSAASSWSAALLSSTAASLCAASQAAAAEIDKSKAPSPAPITTPGSAALMPVFQFGAGASPAPAAAVVCAGGVFGAPAGAAGLPGAAPSADAWAAQGKDKGKEEAAGSGGPLFMSPAPAAGGVGFGARLLGADAGGRAVGAGDTAGAAAVATPQGGSALFALGTAPAAFGGAGGLFGSGLADGAPTFSTAAVPTFGVPAVGDRPAGAGGAPMFGAAAVPTFGAPAGGHQPAGAGGAPTFGAAAVPTFGAPAGGHQPAGAGGAPTFGAAAVPTFGAPAGGDRPAGAGGAPMFGAAAVPTFGAPAGRDRPAGASGFTFGAQPGSSGAVAASGGTPATPTFGAGGTFGANAAASFAFGGAGALGGGVLASTSGAGAPGAVAAVAAPAPVFGSGVATPTPSPAPAPAFGGGFGAAFAGATPGPNTLGQPGNTPFQFGGGQAAPSPLTFAFGATPSPGFGFGGLATPPTLGGTGANATPGASPPVFPFNAGSTPVAAPVASAGGADGAGNLSLSVNDFGKSTERRKVRAARRNQAG